MRGSVHQKGNKWYIVVQVEQADGKKKPKWISGYKSEQEAENDLPRIRVEIEGGVFVSEKARFSEYADKWLKHVEKRVSASTYVTYKWVMEKAKERFKCELTKIKSIMIQDFIDSQDLSKTSVRYIHRILNIAFKQAIKWQLLNKNPCDNVSPPKKTKKAFSPYSDDQIRTLIEAAEKTSIYLPVLIAVSCGLRRGEICNLEWSNIDFEKGVMYVSEGKTDNAPRAVCIPDFVIGRLKPLRGIGKVVNLQPDYVYKRFVKLVKALELPEITFHDLRHFCASWLLKNGVPINAVSVMLGHSSPSFTLATYVHLLPDMSKQASDKMDVLMKPKKKQRAKNAR